MAAVNDGNGSGPGMWEWREQNGRSGKTKMHQTESISFFKKKRDLKR